jgi:predicted lipoprotein with Yx(FWY)xxD motif
VAVIASQVLLDGHLVHVEVAGDDGSEQVTYAGHPLYRFLLDHAPGQTNGEGSQDFGAGWDVLSPAGEKIEAGA